MGLTTYSNNAALVTNPPSGSVGECTIDVSIAAAIGQGSNINVYFTENSEAGWEAFLQRAIFPVAGDNPPSVLTASWVLYLGDDAGTIGNPSIPGTFANVVSGYLQIAAMRGITMLIAIGDWGSANQVLDSHCHVGYPNSDPWATGCGGTIIGNITATGFEEWTWSDANNFASPFQSFPYVSTGGGVSDNFPIPAYQTAAGILPVSKNDGNSRRGVPDVAGMIAMDGFFFVGVGGPGQNAFIGTSLVAPLYAGLIAVVNAFLGRSIGFLNPTVYTYGPEICNDVRFGNNDAGNGPAPPDAPFYLSSAGWDACTGWGSIDGFRLLAAVAPAPIIVTVIADGGDFGNVCAGSFTDEILTINNTGFSLLLVSDIASSSPDFITPAVASYPLAIAPGGSIDVVIRFRPAGLGPKSATLTIFSNDLLGPHAVGVSGFAPAPRLVLAIANSGNFGRTCVGSFADEPLILNNSGHCLLSITGITSSSGDFLLPQVRLYPIAIGPGDSLPLPIRFQPVSFGPKVATLTVNSNDPAGPQSIAVSGDAPSGKLAVTGSTCFGGVKACCGAERTISICNVGDCALHVTSVAFKRKSRHWKLINNPFPATLHAGSCLCVVIRYKANEKCPRSCELVIESDDPNDPIKTLDVMAFTIWSDCSCKGRCEDCQKGCCEKCDKECHCEECPDDCCDDDDEG